MNTPHESARVAVVVLNWNGLDDTLACVESLLGSDWPRMTVIVVDNGSDEPAGPAISARFPGVAVVRSPTNLGFAGGMNVGLRRAIDEGADYVLLLNNDTTVDPTMVRSLIEAAVDRADAGIVSPLILDFNQPDLVTSAGWRFDPRRGHPGRPLLADTRLDGEQHGVREVDASSGEAMLVSADAVRRAGMLDETLYLRLEDIDWSLRMRAAGLRNYTVLHAHLLHRISVASGGEHSPLTAYYHTRNMLTVCSRYAPMGSLRSVLRHAETLAANLAHARRSDQPLASARGAVAGWRDYLRGTRGPRGA